MRKLSGCMCCVWMRCVWVQARCLALDKDKVKAVADLAALRIQFDEREAQFRVQVAAPTPLRPARLCPVLPPICL